MADDLERSVELLERLLGDRQLRRRFRTDAASVLTEAGLPGLAAGLGHGGRALMTLEMRESRSSLAGVMVAAAAEGVDLGQFAEHAAPALARDAGSAIDHLMQQPHHATPTPVHDAAAPQQQPATASNFDAPAATPSLAEPASATPHPADASLPTSHRADASLPTSHPADASLPTSQPAASAGTAQPTAAATAQPAAMQTPSQGARLVTNSGEHTPHHASRGSGSGGAAVAPDPGDAAGAAGVVYPGDQATPQQIAAWMGAHAAKAGLPPELPVMAALTESGLRNLNYGDRDSVGFFQMRLGIWDQGAYAGYPTNPQLQIQWFIDHAVAVKEQYPELATNPNRWGEWVADIEQPAEQFRYRYQLQLSSAQALLHGTDLAAGATVAPVAPAAPPVPVGQAALKVAMHFTGGDRSGSGLDTGPTSAEMVQFAYAQQGVQMPKVAAAQFDLGIPVAHHNLKPGDAVFFAERDGYVDHVGLFVGNGRFITAAPAGGGVRLAPIDDPPFQGQYIGARRFTVEALGDPGRYARPLPTIKP